ncbi:hypothetical protein ACFL1L_04180 [Thermoplasmatota archaeon]
MFYLRKKPKEKFRETIELFDEKTNEIVRKIHFKSPKDFDKFLEDFRLMRYPGYSWRYKDKSKKKGKIE